jgi:hypothetical protein
MEAAALVLSNGLLLLPVWWALRRARPNPLYAEAAALLALMFSSSAHHACQTLAWCIFTPALHLLLDVATVQLAMVVIFVFIIGLSHTIYSGVFYITFFYLILIMVLVDPVSGATAFALALAMFALLFVRLFASYVVNGSMRPRIDWREFAVAIALASVAVFLFMWKPDEPQYWLTHSIWHLLMFVGIYFIFEARDTEHYVFTLPQKL